ncbi:MAG: BamA/TamA family outer membrane protein [Fidelibacterota bacterium]|nr:MAG: BamA/TamA family outer membrane protein [Candidatus Neomarinimicrobiota bacterium]
MKSISSILLGMGLILPLRAQEVELILPDTTLKVTSTGAVVPYLSDRLLRAGVQGQLGLLYRLGRTYSSQTKGLLSLEYQNVDSMVPSPDTLLARDGERIWKPQLVSFLALADLPEGEHLTSAGYPAWEVERKSYFSHGEGYGILYDLNDISSKTVMVQAAYEGAKDRKGRVVGDVNLDLPNLLGTLRYLHIHWQRLSPITQTINLVYAEPRLPLIPLGARITFYQDLRDTLYLQRDAKVQLTSMPGHGWNVGIGVGLRNLKVTSHGRDQGLMPYQLRNINLFVQRLTFNHPANPSKGYRIDLALEGGTVTGAGVNPQAALARGDLALESVHSLARWTLSQHIGVMGVTGYKFTAQLADFGRFGGSTSVRGYREAQFLAPWGIVSRMECRYRTGKDTRVHLFLDMGLVSDVPLLFSGGVGLVLRAGRNLLQVDLAWNREDVLRTGKVHFRLLNFLSEGAHR